MFEVFLHQIQKYVKTTYTVRSTCRPQYKVRVHHSKKYLYATLRSTVTPQLEVRVQEG